MKAIVDDIVMGRGEVQTIKEESPKSSSNFDGEVDGAIQSVQGMLRVMKCSLEARRRKRIPDERPTLLSC